eukprot:m.69342 g.69342  ORF g.69342 m.69342 type:complete len:263 (-) comp14118_c1_seq2:270-1058(-)
MGVPHCDNVLMLLALSLDMTKEQRAVVTPLMMAGFRDLCTEAGTSVNGGQTVLNPWMIVGGVATYVAKESDYINPEQGQAGDVLVLTKPLGTQPAVNAHQWLGTDAYKKVADVITPEETLAAYAMAMSSMARLNNTAAALMHKYDAHGATDVTGFGILGHVHNLAEAQKAEVDLVLDTMPIIKGMPAVNSKFNFRLTQGYSAETSGGLLIMMPADKADGFVKEISEIDGHPAWIVGRVVAGARQGRLGDDLKIEEVTIPTLG